MTIETAVGPADVLYRLALVVECADALSQLPIRTDVRIGREVPPARLAPGFDPSWPCLDFDRHGPARSVLCFDFRTPTQPVVVRIVDQQRRFVARRVAMPMWTLAEIVAAEANPPTIAALSRRLRPWLSPGSGYAVSRAATTIRGRVARNGRPVRWARVTALGPGAQAVGWAHADERGEFVLVVADTGTMPPPAPSDLSLDLKVVAPDPSPDPAVYAADAYADLVVEPAARPASPPSLNDLDNDVLRGRAVPAGYAVNTATVPSLQVPVGQEMVLTADVPFAA